MLSEEKDVWFVWDMDENDFITLRSVCTTAELAGMHCEKVAEEDQKVMAWTELVPTNHVFDYKIARGLADPEQLKDESQ